MIKLWLWCFAMSQSPAHVEPTAGVGSLNFGAMTGDFHAPALPGFDGRCPKCKALGQTSRVYPGGMCMRTLLGEYSYYDEAGVFHHHDPNATTCGYSCSRGHTFTVVDRESGSTVTIGPDAQSTTWLKDGGTVTCGSAATGGCISISGGH